MVCFSMRICGRICLTPTGLAGLAVQFFSTCTLQRFCVANYFPAGNLGSFKELVFLRIARAGFFVEQTFGVLGAFEREVVGAGECLP